MRNCKAGTDCAAASHRHKLVRSPRLTRVPAPAALLHVTLGYSSLSRGPKANVHELPTELPATHYEVWGYRQILANCKLQYYRISKCHCPVTCCPATSNTVLLEVLLVTAFTINGQCRCSAPKQYPALCRQCLHAHGHSCLVPLHLVARRHALSFGFSSSGFGQGCLCFSICEQITASHHEIWEFCQSIAKQFGHASGKKTISRTTRSPGSLCDSLLPFFCLKQVRTDLQY